MYEQKFDAINHPVRMRIFQLLYGNQLSIHQIADLLPDVPRPSLYRHVRKLQESGLIRVAAPRRINGIEERFYTSVEGLIDPAELEKPGGIEKFAAHVSTYGAVVAQALAQYVIRRGVPDLTNIAARDYIFYATEEEFTRLRKAIYALLQEMEQQPPAPGRTQRRMFVIAHPMLTTTMNQESEHGDVEPVS
ncbi:MAG: helix-turn-helix domain-containing protein [Roseiflexus sp.]|uniref:helix-turn-helix domain-containing protein n=1 Tax=Roseiflexus sp. TaxID=2562120 RepID=UPI0025DB354F|nr:helix-turn-helix domain-containing protein [Roseiflexus sp.]MCL6542543.1 helix-turn-helix domain-containing protein [Roseiflexus sp.]